MKYKVSFEIEKPKWASESDFMIWLRSEIGLYSSDTEDNDMQYACLENYTKNIEIVEM
jgi:hypothetical protein